MHRELASGRTTEISHMLRLGSLRDLWFHVVADGPSYVLGTRPHKNEYGHEGHMTFRDCWKRALSLTRKVDHKVKGVGRKALQAPCGDDELEGSE